MTRNGERLLRRSLWVLYGVLGLGGLALLGAALFIPREARPLMLRAPAATFSGAAKPGDAPPFNLAERRFWRRAAPAARAAAPAKAQDTAIEQMIKLTGILDFGGKQPTLAVIETLSSHESKAYKAGDRIGETGARVKDIKDYIIVEFETRRFKVTFAGVQELPAAALGKD